MIEKIPAASMLSKVAAAFKYPEGKPVMKSMQPGTRVKLVREPSNAFDPNAIKIYGTDAAGTDIMLGYVPAKDAARLKDCTIVVAYKHSASWDAIVIDFIVPS